MIDIQNDTRVLRYRLKKMMTGKCIKPESNTTVLQADGVKQFSSSKPRRETMTRWALSGRRFRAHTCPSTYRPSLYDTTSVVFNQKTSNSVVV